MHEAFGKPYSSTEKHKTTPGQVCTKLLSSLTVSLQAALDFSFLGKPQKALNLPPLKSIRQPHILFSLTAALKKSLKKPSTSPFKKALNNPTFSLQAAL